MSEKENIAHRLKGHLGADPARLPLLSQDFGIYERPNLHLAIEELVAECNAELLGIVDFDHEVTIPRLAHKSSAKLFAEGPVEFVDITLAGGTKLACVQRGLYLFRVERAKLALLVVETVHRYPPRIRIEVMANDRTAAERFLRSLVSATQQGKAYRGRVLSLELDCYRQIAVTFHSLPPISRHEIILPEAILRRLESHTIDFSQQIERLRNSGRHVKRGVLLHGPPGTGKTLSAMYLAAQMPERTVLIITGAGIGALETACTLARLLQPATVVLEDVDLIGTRREHQMVDANALLFELLNQMDGLGDDADVLFVLTTNRPDILEPALASRPGRIDQAIEIPLPDDDCRLRLIELYGRGLKLNVADLQGLVDRTEGASAAFIRELLRKSALIAAAADTIGDIVVLDEHINEALAELLVGGGDLTKSLLGASKTLISTEI
ncbi:MAG: AAA family ATPase [Pirellulales bacterium]